MNPVDVATTPGIAGIIWGALQLGGGLVPVKYHRPLAGALGIALALLSYVTVSDAYGGWIVAISVGVTAGAAALGLSGPPRQNGGGR